MISYKIISAVFCNFRIYTEIYCFYMPLMLLYWHQKQDNNTQNFLFGFITITGQKLGERIEKNVG